MSGEAPGRAEAPSLADAIARYRAGCVAEALTAIAGVLARTPADAAAHHAHGVILEAAGDPAGAADAYREAIARDPALAAAWINFGRLVDARGDPALAARCYDRALMIDGGNALALANLGELFLRRGDLATARALLEAAHAADPTLPEAAFNLGRVRLAEQRLDEAHTLFATATLRGDPTQTAFADAFLLSALCHPGIDRDRLDALHRDWGDRYAARVGTGACPPCRRAEPADRPLVVGLLSGDFNGHPASRFLEPLFAHHDRTRIELVAYHTLDDEDATTTRLRAAAGRWRSVAGWSTERVVRQIDADRIDVLLDLSGHTRGSRFDVLARRPAPLLGEWLGYLHASGLPGIDFRLADPLMEDGPADGALPLPDGFWCYAPYPEAPPLAAAAPDGPRRFGSFNHPMKINDAVLACWSRLLLAVPDATLTLGGFNHAEGRAAVAATLAAGGVDPARLSFLPKLPVADYLRAVDAVDVALDPFPYGGGTTTFDCLWMGTPVVTLAGNRPCGRGAAAILRRLELPGLVAADIDAYVEIAAGLTRPTGESRTALRERLAASPMSSGPRFCQSFEDALRVRWRAP